MEARSHATIAPVVLVPVIAVVALAWIGLILVPMGHDPVAFAGMWLAMTIAMMLPTVLRPLQRAADGSPARAGAFVAGYAAPWLVAGLPGFAILSAVPWTAPWVSFAWLVAGAYLLLPRTQRLLVDCRRVPWSGSPTRYGLRQGTRCVASCGPLMIATMATAMVLPSAALGVALLVAVTALVCWQKSPRTSARAIAAVGVAVLLVGALSFVALDADAHPAHASGQTSGHASDQPAARP